MKFNKKAILVIMMEKLSKDGDIEFMRDSNDASIEELHQEEVL